MTTTQKQQNAACRSRSSPTPKRAPRSSRTRPRAPSTTTTPQKRKQSHYEDVTVEVQPDPRHYLSQGWLYGFADGKGGYPLEWTALKAWGSDRPVPERGPGSGGKGYDWPAHGWHEFRDPNEEWELTLYRYNANVVRQLNQNVEAARQAKAFEQWNPNWVQFVAQHVGAWMHVDHGLGLYLFANANRRAPTNMHNNAISVNSMHRIRAAQDLALYNLTLTEEIEGFDGTAHLATWDSDPAWQGVRETAEQLTGIWDWCEAIFAANVVFEPLVGEMFRSNLVQQAAPANGDFVTPTLSAPRSTTSRSGTCATPGRCSGCWSRTRSSRSTTRRSCSSGCRTGCPGASRPPARCSRCGRSPTRSRRASRTASTGRRAGSPESCPISVCKHRRS